MLKTCYQKIITLLLLLAFTSQTLAAAAMTCELEKTVKVPAAASEMMVNIAHHDMEHMHHNMSAMSVASDSDSDSADHNHPTSDCCKTMGHCLFGGCALAASNHTHFSFNRIDSTTEDFYSSVTPTPLVTALYRPPISG